MDLGQLDQALGEPVVEGVLVALERGVQGEVDAGIALADRAIEVEGDQGYPITPSIQLATCSAQAWPVGP